MTYAEATRILMATSQAHLAAADLCCAQRDDESLAPHIAAIKRHLEAAMMALEGETVPPETGKETTDD